jgi:hypothetical protein
MIILLWLYIFCNGNPLVGFVLWWYIGGMKSVWVSVLRLYFRVVVVQQEIVLGIIVTVVCLYI